MHTYTCVTKSLIKELKCEFKILNNNYIAAHLVGSTCDPFLNLQITAFSGFCSSTSYYYILLPILLIFLNTIQIDTKGIPSIVNNQMLKKHPMAIAKIRARLEQSHGPHLPSESLASASASFSTTLPQQSSRYFEDAVPTKDFVQGFRTLSQNSCSK